MNNNLRNFSFPIKPFFLLLIFFSAISTLLLSQPTRLIKRYVNRLINDTTIIKEPQFIGYPTLAYAPETSWEFGLSSLFVYYARKDTSNRLSEINGFTFFTLQRQYGLWFEHALYTPQNEWSFLGRLRFQNFPLLYFGIGPNTPSEFQARVDGLMFNIKERALKKIARNVFMGAEIDVQRLSSVNFVPHGQDGFQKPLGHQGSFNLGLGSGILYDSRHNVMNVREGGFAELALLHYDKKWGSRYSFSSVISDNRIYKAINKRNVFAAQVFGQFSIGQPPFNLLSLLGGENLMRGYYSGRYRDRNQLSGQAEFRMLPLPFNFTRRWGATVFAGTGSVFNSFHTLTTNDFVWSAGTGLRFLLFPKKDIYSRLDVAFTREGRGIYIFIGEAF